MQSSYRMGRGLRRYLAGAASARAGDEMSGPALLLLGLAVTGRPGTGAELLASVTIAAAAGGLGARTAVLTAAAVVGLAIPAARTLRHYPPEPAPAAHQAGPRSMAPHWTAPHWIALRRQMADGFAVIVTRRALRRATLTSVVSYAGIGMLLVCCPVLGAQRLGGA